MTTEASAGGRPRSANGRFMTRAAAAALEAVQAPGGKEPDSTAVAITTAAKVPDAAKTPDVAKADAKGAAKKAAKKSGVKKADAKKADSKKAKKKSGGKKSKK